MAERFLDKYRIPTARLQNWDYGWNGIYFITICTEGRDNYSYKSAVSKLAHPMNSCFGWQERFYEHIVQSDREFDRIRQYIYSNPVNWEKDKYFGKR